MIIAIDIGNTNIKIGVFNGDELINAFRFSVRTSHTADEFGVNLRMVMSDSKLSASDIDGVIISSVQPELNYTVEHACKHYLGRSPMIVGVGIKTGLNIKYTNPQELGADRIVNSVAAYRLYGAPCIVVDFGTATVFNYVAAGGEYMGGCIAPGIKTSLDSLVEKTAKLPSIELIKPERIINRTTGTNMQAGLIYGFAGLVKYIIEQMKKECGAADVKVVATGGLSEVVKAVLQEKIIDVTDRSLTLKGLKIIYDSNIGKGE
ncbi:MAG: type III pantothenate kinase [Clostridia bacterium]|nr:type III pantothenate kinase [Clostridia bacterium]